MKKLNGQQITKWLDARHVRERVVLLVAGVGIVAMLWLTLVHDPVVSAREVVARNITIANGAILEEQDRQAQILATDTSDPNAFALARRTELRDAMQDADARLNQLYGDLISPQRMAQVITSILQNETQLGFVSFQNIPSQALLPEVAPDASANAEPAVQVYRHGLQMVFEGNFIEAIYYLRSLERLDGNFFWENFAFALEDYPNARISIEIYTLSTEEGFIGV